MTNWSEINRNTSEATSITINAKNAAIDSEESLSSDIDEFSIITYNNNNNHKKNNNAEVKKPFISKKKKKKNYKKSTKLLCKERQQRQWLHVRRYTQKQMIGIRRPFYCIFLILILLLALVYFPLYTTVQTRYGSHPDWGLNTSRNISEYVLPDIETTLLEPRDVCRDKVFLIIIVCSSLHNFAARQMIRETWGNTSEFNYDMFEKMHAHMRGKYLQPSISRIQHYSEYLQPTNSDKFWNSQNGESSTTINDTINNINNNNNNNNNNNKSNDNLFSSFNNNMKIPVRILFLVGLNKDEKLSTSGTTTTSSSSSSSSSKVNQNETINRLHNELLEYNDIIQENFIDTYSNLTIKSVYALKWMTQRCLHQSAFFMKCDDDTFVNVPNLLHYLLGGTMPIYNDTLDLYDVQTINNLAQKNRLLATENYLAGYLFCTSRPVADRSSKWYMPSYMFPGDKYPAYLSGAGYIMSTDVVSKLYTTSLNTTLIYLEDVYVTGMCPQRLHMPRIHQPLFGYNRSDKLCHFKGTFTQHEMKDDSLLDAYAFVANVSNICPPPSYIFRMHLHKYSKCR